MSNVSEARDSKVADARAALARIESFLAKCEDLDEKLHWGHVGSLTEAVDRLEDICKFLSA